MRRHLHVITNSEIEDFRKCRAYWGYRDAELLRPLEQPLELSYGTLYHLGCDAGWRAAWSELELSTTDRLHRACSGAMLAIHQASAEHRTRLETEAEGDRQQQALEELTEQTEIAQWATVHYFERRVEDLDLVPIAIEARFDVPIPTRAGQGGHLHQNGKMDLVLWDRRASQILLDEHKTSGYAVQTYEGRLQLLTQPTGYLRALQVLLARVSVAGWGSGFWNQTTPAVRGLMERERAAIWRSTAGLIRFNVSRRAKPGVPSVNQLRMAAKAAALDTPLSRLYHAQEQDEVNRGEVSAADIDTLPRVYQRALDEQVRERHQPVTDKQRARLAALEAKANPYFQQFEFFRGPAELERWRQEMWVEAKAIRAAERDPTLRTRNPYACTGPGSPKCVYAGVCASPEDPEARAAFRVATTRHEELDHGDGGFGIEQWSAQSVSRPAPDPF
jgi:hypothetical protein